MLAKAILSGDAIWSTRDGVNVLFLHGRGPGDWNNHFPPVNRRRRNESITDYLRDVVRETIHANRPGWAPRVTEIVIRENVERGSYHWTAYGELLRIRVDGPTGSHSFPDDERADAFIRSQCIGWYHRPAQFCKTVLS